MKILSCLKEHKELKEEEWRATQTSGMVIAAGGHRMALYANSRQQVGENLDELLTGRNAGLDKPIQMSDALAARQAVFAEKTAVEKWSLAYAACRCFFREQNG